MKNNLPSTIHKVIFENSINMREVSDEGVDLIVTSPPYPMIEMWDKMFLSFGCKNYEEIHTYLSQVWKECYRVLAPGGIICINVGDATRRMNGIFKLFANHSKIIEICEEIGFTTLPYILWKKPSCRANAFLGSGFLPPNAYVTLDCEYILIFRKGNLRKFKSKDEIRYKSMYTKEERDIWFSQIWDVNGIKQSHKKVKRRLAAYPDEIVKRLIRMFSVQGDIVLDPFLGTGTTSRVAAKLNRNSIGYEIDIELMEILKESIDATFIQRGEK